MEESIFATTHSCFVVMVADFRLGYLEGREGRKLVGARVGVEGGLGSLGAQRSLLGCFLAVVYGRLPTAENKESWKSKVISVVNSWNMI